MQCHRLIRLLQARPLTVDADIRPVVDYLRSEGLQKEQIVKVIKGHPPILSYSAEERLKPLFDYLATIGFEDRNDVRAVLLVLPSPATM